MRYAILILVVLLSSCEQPRKLSQDTLNSTEKKLTYFKDSHGLCYAALGSSTHAGYLSISITLVPCDKVGL